jgi:hypothetical protein
MPSADRSAMLQRMTSLRPIAALHERSYLPYWRLFMSPESRILEIVELVVVLRADGFSEAQVFTRLREVQRIAGAEWMSAPDPLDASVFDYLRQYHATYLDLGEETWRSALSDAKAWTEIHLSNRANSHWPPREMLGERAKSGFKALDCYLEGPLGRDVRRLRARAIAGDQLRGYSTNTLMWSLMMGSGGYALVRKGLSTDHIQTRMN